jgi:hypothetical protein
MPGAIEEAALDVESGRTSRRVKVHSRCAKDPQRLKSTLEQLYGRGFTIEMRHNMYIINSVELIDQRKIVSVLNWTWGFPRPFSCTDNWSTARWNVSSALPNPIRSSACPGQHCRPSRHL